jgi:hypothetical protein
MKMLFLIIALAGFTMSSNAQTCSKRVVHHKGRAIHHRVARVHRTIQQPVTFNNTEVTQPAPCIVYRKHNMVATECPDVFYDNSKVEFNRENTYMGNYPKNVQPGNTVNMDNQVDGLIAPQHNVIEDYHGVAPSDGNHCHNCRAK